MPAASNLRRKTVPADFNFSFPFSKGDWRRVNRHNPCPVCHKSDFCEVSADGSTVHCMRIASEHPLAYRQGGWLHYLSPTYKTATAADLRPTEINQSLNTPDLESGITVPLAPIAERHKAISRLLGLLELNETHREYLAAQGFSLEKAWELGYRTLLAGGRDRLAKAIVKTVGAETAGQLAFLYEKKGKAGSRYFQFAAARGEILLIPIRDKNGNMLGLKGRWERIDPETGEIERNYRVLSAGSSGGASLGTPLHIARPSQKIEAGRVVITEGEKKADYIAWRTGQLCIGVQGTGNWRATRGKEHLVSVLADLGAKRVEIAFDADLETNPRVARDLYQMGCQLQAAGFEVWERRWPLAAAKGYDDLLREGQSSLSRLTLFSGIRNFSEKGSWVKKFIELDRETRDILQFEDTDRRIRPLLTVQEARDKHAALFRQTFTEHFFTLGKKRQSLLVTSNPGTGKTHAALAEALAAIKNFPEGRILYIADNKEVYRQWIKPGALLNAAWESGLVAVREGRQRNKGLFECRKFEECETAGSQRHAPTWDVCANCPFFSKKNWQQHLKTTGQADTEMPWNCQEEGYWKGVATANAARMVLAPKASFLNNSQELAEFDVIIVDESIIEHLLETVNVTRETLALWRESMQRQAPTTDEEYLYTGWQQDFEPFTRLFALLEQAIALQEGKALNEGISAKQKLFPFRPVLQEAENLTGANLDDILENCRDIQPNSKTGRYSWERPLIQLNGKPVFPLHFARELVEALAEEINPARNDTRCWFNLQKETLAVSVYRPRQHLLKLLKGSQDTENLYRNSFEQPPSVILLDATPSPVLQNYVLGADTKTVNYEVAQHLEVTQLTNSLYTKDELVAREGRALQEVSRLLDQESRKYRSAAIFCHKAFNPDAGNGPLKLATGVTNPGITWGHFDRDNKALNGLNEVEFIAIVGHYCHPLDSLRAQVQAFRFGDNPNPVSEEPDGGWKIRPYAWSNPEGKGIARRCRADADPEVQAAVEHSEQAAILQAIGRGRPTLRSANKPLKVLLVTAVPLGTTLPVTRLAEIKELLGENIISLAQAESLARGRSQRLQYHAARRNNAAGRVLATLEKTEEVNNLSGPAYLSLDKLAQVSRTSRWQLQMLGIDRIIRLGTENKASCGPELYLYIYKQHQLFLPFVFQRNSGDITGQTAGRLATE